MAGISPDSPNGFAPESDRSPKFPKKILVIVLLVLLVGASAVSVVLFSDAGGNVTTASDTAGNSSLESPKGYPQEKKVSGPFGSFSKDPKVDTGCYSFRISNPLTGRATNSYCNTEVTYRDSRASVSLEPQVSQIFIYPVSEIIQSLPESDYSLEEIAEAWKKKRANVYQVVSEKGLGIGAAAYEIIDVDKSGLKPRYYRTVIVDSYKYYVIDDERLRKKKRHRFFLITGNNDQSTGSQQVFAKMLDSLRWK